MIKEEELRRVVTNFIQDRGFTYDSELESYHTSLKTEPCYFSSLQEILSFFKLRGYQYRGQDLIRTKVKNTLRLAGIQRYLLDPIEKGFFIDNYYCCRFQDLQESVNHLPGFFMTGLHDFEIKSVQTFLFHLENLLDFFKGSSVTQVKWDSWTDGVNQGPSLEFFSEGLQVANMVFTLKDIKGNLLKNPYLDAGLGLERYLSLSKTSKKVVVSRPRLLLFLIFCNTIGINPGRRGVSDNLKRVYRRITAFFTRQDLAIAEKEWIKNKPSISLDFTFQSLDIINKKVKSNS